MKIGLVCPYSIAKGGGVQECVFAMQADLAKRGHDAYIITPQPTNYEHDASKKNIIFVGAAADFRAPWHTTGQISASTDPDNIDEMLASENFDILHFHEPWVPMLSKQILSRSNTVNIATFHAKLPESVMTRTVMQLVTPYTKSVLKYLHELTAVSDPAAEYVRSLSDQPVSIIPNGIDLAKYRRPGRRSDKSKQKTIFYVGRLETRKGVKYLIKAFKLLSEQQSDVSLVIAGDGPERNKLEQLAKDLDIDPARITFLGYITDDEKLRYLHTADLFCAPALYGESFGIVLLEAMAAGLVTVAGNNPGYASVMQGMGAISLVNPKDCAELARRLDLLLHESELRDLWRNWAKEQVPQYSYKHIVDQYWAVYELALKRHAQQRTKE
ncbi:MAG TPA: glycosyltransferase family 4 protein [Candidatus Saccharimonadales bacterium]|jgi:phosphatidylinositol alpha-mannosyltransferase|nr:glycosyltransferase family 4 protein [Candidatus Saccharimonadales bacterium]